MGASRRILTIEDHPLLLQGIATLLGDKSDMTVVAEATTGRRSAVPQTPAGRDALEPPVTRPARRSSTR
jgi:DNA-binding NarL/FixJ family response regulator